MKLAKTEKAVFAAGCFWGVEDIFSKVPGVKGTRAGYTGGHTANPGYEQVCSDRTGHAEAVEIEFDPSKVSYEKLLELFWKLHDPTQENRQGPDVGSQYRSAVFYHNEKQRELAEKSKKALEKSGKFGKPIMTQIVAAKEFFEAEDYHQKYVQKHRIAIC